MLLSTRISSLRAFKLESFLRRSSRTYLNTEIFSYCSRPRSPYQQCFSRTETFNRLKPFNIASFSSSNNIQKRYQSLNSNKLSQTSTTPPIEDKQRNQQHKTWLDRLPPKIAPYIYLTRLDKPIGTWLLYWPCAWSITMASYSANIPISQTAWMLGLFGAGAMIMRGAGCTINDIWDKDIDNKVERTKNRPLASGAITPAQAIAFLSLQLSAGLAILTQLNWYSIKLGAASLSLVTIYPFMKRVTYWPQFILGTAFNWGALLGWSAVLGSSNWSVTIPLYMGGICWTLVYDTIYAHQDKKDDIHAGVKSTALYFGTASPQYLTFFSGSFLTLLSLSGYMNSQGVPFYVISVGGAAAHIGWQLKNIKYDDPKDCWNKFASNFWVGTIIWGGIVTDWVWKSGAAAYIEWVMQL